MEGVFVGAEVIIRIYWGDDDHRWRWTALQDIYETGHNAVVAESPRIGFKTLYSCRRSVAVCKEEFAKANVVTLEGVQS